MKQFFHGPTVIPHFKFGIGQLRGHRSLRVGRSTWKDLSINFVHIMIELNFSSNASCIHQFELEKRINKNTCVFKKQINPC